MKSMVAILCIFISTSVLAQEKLWECKNTKDSWDNITIVAGVTDKKGFIKAGEIIHEATFINNGHFLEWHFGEYISLKKGKMIDHLFIMMPNNIAAYFDFTITDNALLLFNCRKTG